MLAERAVPQGLPDPKQVGAYLLLAQVGVDLVAPIIVGLIIDQSLGWTPWATVAGAVLGLVGGLYHLVVIVNRPKNGGAPSERTREGQ
jgi:F0F1-type ATP synthase assembly protein I